MIAALFVHMIHGLLELPLLVLDEPIDATLACVPLTIVLARGSATAKNNIVLAILFACLDCLYYGRHQFRDCPDHVFQSNAFNNIYAIRCAPLAIEDTFADLFLQVIDDFDGSILCHDSIRARVLFPRAS
jgi:hypothetical protein